MSTLRSYIEEVCNSLVEERQFHSRNRLFTAYCDATKRTYFNLNAGSTKFASNESESKTSTLDRYVLLHDSISSSFYKLSNDHNRITVLAARCEVVRKILSLLQEEIHANIIKTAGIEVPTKHLAEFQRWARDFKQRLASDEEIGDIDKIYEEFWNGQLYLEDFYKKYDKFTKYVNQYRMKIVNNYHQNPSKTYGSKTYGVLANAMIAYLNSINKKWQNRIRDMEQSLVKQKYIEESRGDKHPETGRPSIGLGAKFYEEHERETNKLNSQLTYLQNFLKKYKSNQIFRHEVPQNEWRFGRNVPSITKQQVEGKIKQLQNDLHMIDMAVQEAHRFHWTK